MEFRAPEFVPTKWLFVVVMTAGTILGVVVGGAFVTGIWKQDIEGKLLAAEHDINDINAELRFRIQIRTQVMEKLDKIQDSITDVKQRVSRMEGKMYH